MLVRFLQETQIHELDISRRVTLYMLIYTQNNKKSQIGIVYRTLKICFQKKRNHLAKIRLVTAETLRTFMGIK